MVGWLVGWLDSWFGFIGIFPGGLRPPGPPATQSVSGFMSKGKKSKGKNGQREREIEIDLFICLIIYLFTLIRRTLGVLDPKHSSLIAFQA